MAFAAGALCGLPGTLPAALAAAFFGLAAPRRIEPLRWGLLLSVAVLLGGSVSPPGSKEAGRPPRGPIYKGEVTAVTASGAMVAKCDGDRLWVPGRFGEEGVMRGDSMVVAGWRRGRFLTPAPVRTTFAQGPIRELRGSLVQLLESRLQPRLVSATAQTLLLGFRGRMSRRARDGFRDGGVTHLLAVSGMHVGMVAALALFILRRALGRGWRATLLACALVALYAAVTGLRPSAIRAGVMACAALLWLRWAGGTPGLLWLWGAAAAVVLAADPMAVFDTGAQMSFGAVLALILAGRTFYIGHKPLAWAANGLYAGLVVTVALAPLVSAAYGDMRPLGPLLTVVSLPLVMAVMVLSVPAAIPWVGGPFARLLEWVVWSWNRAVEAISAGGVEVGGTTGLLAWGLLLGLLVMAARWRGLHRRLR